MGSANYFASGQWNFYCDLCGAKRKSSDGVQTWNKLWVCRHHKEVRNPQDFVRGVAEDFKLPWSRPTPPDTFVPWDVEAAAQDDLPLADNNSNAIEVYFGPEPSVPLNQAPVNAWALNAVELNGPVPLTTDPANWYLPLTEAFSIFQGLFPHEAEALSLGETFTTVASYLPAAPEALALAESITVTTGVALIFPEALSLAESATVTYSLSFALPETLSLTESVSAVLDVASWDGALNDWALNSTTVNAPQL